jgi:hypothetical protein
MESQVKMLKVKIKSLADESRTIRLEEKRAGKDDTLRNKLHNHRVGDVRREQRLSLLAYGFIRDRPYRSMEAKTKREPDWTRVMKLVNKFGPACSASELQTLFDAWKCAE